MEKISTEEIEWISDIFHALSNPTRLEILFALFEMEEANVSTLVKNTQITQSGVSHQLRILKQYNLVRSERKGKEIIYKLRDEHVVTICTQMLSHAKEENCDSVAKF